MPLPPSTHFHPFALMKGILYPLLLFLLIAPWLNTIDLVAARYFYSNSGFSSNPLWQWIYTYGFWPGWVLFGLGCLGFIASVSFNKPWIKPSLFVILTLAIGSGFFIHFILKDHWGRPRPRQVIEFGGNQQFRPFYHPQFEETGETSKSFSCGHCSMGFYFFSLALLGRWRNSLLWHRLGLTLAFSLGIALSLARIAVGGHFISDTLVSALIMWLTSWVGAYFFLFKTRL